MFNTFSKKTSPKKTSVPQFFSPYKFQSFLTKLPSPTEKLKVKQAYKTISNIYDSKEINQGLESLNTVQQKVRLVDVLIKRREELKKSEDREKLNKLTPLINKMKQKYLAKTTLKKKSYEIDNSEESSGCISKASLSNTPSQYRIFSLAGKNLILEEQSPRANSKFRLNLPKIEEGMEKTKDKIVSERKFDEENFRKSTIRESSLISIPSINIIQNEENEKNFSFVKMHERRKTSFFTVVTQFNKNEKDKGIKQNFLEKKRNSMFDNREKVFNTNTYNDFHLIPLESPSILKGNNYKKFKINKLLLKKHQKQHLDTQNIENKLEKEILKFMTENIEDISLNFLNLKNPNHPKNLTIIETKVKGKLNEFLKQDKINSMQKKYYFRDTFLHKIRDSCKKCFKKYEKQPEINPKSFKLFKKNAKKLSPQSIDFMKKQIEKF